MGEFQSESITDTSCSGSHGQHAAKEHQSFAQILTWYATVLSENERQCWIVASTQVFNPNPIWAFCDVLKSWRRALG